MPATFCSRLLVRADKELVLAVSNAQDVVSFSDPSYEITHSLAVSASLNVNDCSAEPYAQSAAMKTVRIGSRGVVEG